jgi:glutaredoxin
MSFVERLLGERPSPRVLVVTKAECPLCDEAKEALERARTHVAFELETRTIEDDPALRQAHALEVPVIFVNGRKALWGKISPVLLLRELRAH